MTDWQGPDADWMPIALGPFHFRRSIDGGSGASDQQIIDWFAKASWKGQTLRCHLKLDSKQGLLRVSLPEASHLDRQYTPTLGLAPAAMHIGNLQGLLRALAGDDASDNDITNWATTASTVWNWMESEFSQAVSAKDVRIFARVNDPLAKEFSEIPADIFRLCRVTDWATGVPAASIAEGPNQARLYALHCVGANWEQQPGIVGTGLPGRATLGKEIIDAEHERRLKSGTAEHSVAAEARVLNEDYRSKYPTSQAPSTKTIENNIRSRHSRHFSAVNTPPKSPPK